MPALSRRRDRDVRIEYVRVIFYTLGICLLGLGLFMLFPALVETYMDTQDWRVFIASAFCCCFVGGCLMMTNRSPSYEMTLRDTYLMTTVLWIVVPIFAGLPFYFTGTGYHLDFTDAVFESVSGLSTTGSTVIAGLDNAPKGILLWRGLTVWIGGAGIIVMVMCVLPYLRVGGMQLFQMESSDRSDKILPRTHQIAIVSTLSYIAVSAVCAFVYWLCGMSAFDAVCHAMATLGTGGFSTHDASFGYYRNPMLEWMGTLFMMVGASPMLLYYTFVTSRAANRPLLYQTKVFWLEVAAVILVMAAYVYHHVPDMTFEKALRLSAFNIASVATTTGFVSTDYGQWGAFAVMVFYFLTVTGGCNGSTCGGIKTFRLVVMTQMLFYEMKKLLYPHGVFAIRMGDIPVSGEVVRSVGIFFMLYVFVFTVLTLCLAFTGLDMLTSMSGVAQAMSGVGPGLGPIIGPAGNFIPLSDFAKWSLIAAMILGRLEIVTVLVLFTRFFWREYASEHIR